MTTTKKIKLRFTKKKQNFKLEESKPKFRPLRKEAHDQFPSFDDVDPQNDVGGRARGPAQNVFVELARVIIDGLGDVGGTIPLEVLASALADGEAGAPTAIELISGQGGDPHMVGGPDPI